MKVPFVSVLILVISVFLYYRLFKSWLFKNSSKIINFPVFSNFKQGYSTQDLVGISELSLAALSHVIFCFILMFILGVYFKDTFPWKFNVSHIIYGVILGLSELNISSIFCFAFIKFFQKVFPKKVPHNDQQWQTISRAGWIRHHIKSFELLPLYLALPILIIQVGSEELIFRGIIPSFLLNNGYSYLLASLVSIVLFVVMQSFHMPSIHSAVFPMVGGLVMGCCHSLLYYLEPDILPLVIAHVTFFLVVII